MKHAVANHRSNSRNRLGNSLLIAGGGTGGHVFPAMAIAQEWLRRGTACDAAGTADVAPEGTIAGERSVVLVGTERGLESKLVPRAGLPLELIRAAGLKGMGGKKLLQNLAMLPGGFWDSERILHRHRFNVAFGVGGYASGPMMLVAMMHRIPSVVFEPNVEPGFTNRVLTGMATRVAVAHVETARRLEAEKAVVSRMPCTVRVFHGSAQGTYFPVHGTYYRRQSRGASDQSSRGGLTRSLSR